jgi:hypothetical protein
MTQETSQSLKDVNSPDNKTDKNPEPQSPVDLEDFEGTEDELLLPTEVDLAKKVAVRRKIEMYWEKKRLREQIGELDEIDLDF